ncbi:unnamed protein product [Blepharisma stoltei]|uniref:Uncharacterized protein n=1 Tax=Blepharisma stoltei TaxID=1481888 RepID=A0AAU9IWT4_9CILI|nr:unnamed protein product [Blepharisma stoltei]
MDPRHKKKETPNAPITSELVLRLSGQANFESISKLSFRSKSNAKIRRIEGLDLCINLQELDLSYQFISKIENLDALVRLKDLNLMENNIKKIENLHTLRDLQSLNLSGNHITEIPKSAIEPLKQLRILKLNKNKISKIEEFANLNALISLEDLSLNGNPALNQPDSDLHVIYYLPSLVALDGSKITNATKQQASRMFSGPPPESWVVRENKVTFVRELSEAQEEKRELQEELKGVERQIDGIKNELENIEAEIGKLKRELESIESTLQGDANEKINVKKREMKLLLSKAEKLRDESENLQMKIGSARDLSQQKEEQLMGLRDEFDFDESENSLENNRQKLESDISELAEIIAEMEYQYENVIQDFNDANNQISALESEIIDLKESSGYSDSTPRWKEEPGRYRKTTGDLKRPRSTNPDRNSKTFSIDKDTEISLCQRKEEILSLIPELEMKKQSLKNDLSKLTKKRVDYIKNIEEKEYLIEDRQRKIEECDQLLTKFSKSSPSPIRSTNHAKKMWESLKTLWGLVSENPWDGESDDIPKAIIRWAENMKDHLSRKLSGNEQYVELAASKRIDEATIQHLTTKYQELVEELSKRPNIEKYEQEISKLSAKLDAYKEQEEISKKNKIKLEKELQDTKEKLTQLEGQWLLSENRLKEFSENEDVKNAQSKVEELLEEQNRLKEKIKQLEAEYELKEASEKDKLSKMKGYCEHKAGQYQSLIEDCERKTKELENLQENIRNQSLLKDELNEKIEIIRKNKYELDLEVHTARSEIRDLKTVRTAEDERDRALIAIRKVADSLEVEFNANSTPDLFTVVRGIEQAIAELNENMEKVERFKVNKEKFVEMYESNTKELQEEWESLKLAKDQIEKEKLQIDMIRSEKRTLDEQVRQLNQATNELQKLKASLERDNIKLEEHSFSLKDSIKSYEDLREKTLRDYQHIQSIHDSEAKKYEDLMSDIQTAKNHYKQLKSDRIDSEAELNNIKFQAAKLEDRTKNLDLEIKEQEKLLLRLKNKQTDEQVVVYRELENIKQLIADKQKEVHNLQSLINDCSAQLARKEEDALFIKKKNEADLLERELIESAIKNRQQVMKEIEGKIENAETTFSRIQQDVDLLSQNFAQKNRKMAQLDSDLEQKQSEYERLKNRLETSTQELKALEEIIRNNKLELRSIDETIVNKNYEADTVLHQLNQKKQELNNTERVLIEKQNLLVNEEQRLDDSKDQRQTEEETVNVLKQQAQSLSTRVAKLTETLERVEAHKHQVLNEIEIINQKMNKEEAKHKSELEQLRNAIGNGEQTLRQLMESVQRCRNKLAHDKEEVLQITSEIENLHKVKEEEESKGKNLKKEIASLQNQIDKLKQEEDTAMVLLALSGHRIDESVRQRIHKLCQSALELESVKAQLAEIQQKEYRYKKSTPALEELENTALYSQKQSEIRPIQILEETAGGEYETEEVRKILHNLEVTRERLRSLTPANEQSYEQ